MPARSPDDRTPVTLDRLPVERDARIVDVPAAHRSELAGEGLRAGRTVRVTGRAPFGGPILLMVGRARLAVSRSVAGVTKRPSSICAALIAVTPRKESLRERGPSHKSWWSWLGSWAGRPSASGIRPR